MTMVLNPIRKPKAKAASHAVPAAPPPAQAAHA
jgi:hypothetical protein